MYLTLEQMNEAIRLLENHYIGDFSEPIGMYEAECKWDERVEEFLSEVENNKLTYGDKIRNRTDEEIAAENQDSCWMHYCGREKCDCYECWLEMLKSEVE